MKIENSVALVTGANRGLGLAIAKALQARGVGKLYAAARDPARITLDGVVPVRLDITDPSQVSEAARACPDVNLLINNAGILRPGRLLTAPGIEAARQQFDTHFFGTASMCTAFAPLLAAGGGGAIVNVLSVLSWLNMSQIGGYCASKSAEWALTNAVRNELRKQGTQVLAVHAAFIDTDMAGGVQAPKTAPEDVARQLLDALEAGREEVLADDISRGVRQLLGSEAPPYLREAAA